MKTILKFAVLAVALLGVQASEAQAANTVTLSWGASPTAGVTYNVYQGTGVGSTKVQVNNVTGSPTVVSTGIPSGAVYCFQVTAVLAGIESTPTNEACKSFAAPVAPQPPTGLVAK